MKGSVKTLLVILIILVVFCGMILVKMYITTSMKESKKNIVIASIPTLQNNIKSDSLYDVKDVLYKDSAILIAVSNPDKSGTDIYFNKKYALNGYDNINMVYIYPYDSTKPLSAALPDDALMGTGKKLGKLQEDWVASLYRYERQIMQAFKKIPAAKNEIS